MAGFLIQPPAAPPSMFMSIDPEKRRPIRFRAVGTRRSLDEAAATEH